MTQSLGKLPPQATDLEEGILGALMLESDTITTVADILNPESFYKDSHKKLYEAIIQLFNKSDPIDLLTVTSQLRKNGTLEIVGGAYKVAEMTNMVNSAANIEYHCRIVAEKAMKRALISLSQTIQNNAYDDTCDVFSLLENADVSLGQITESAINGTYVKINEAWHETVVDMEEGEKRKSKGELSGVPSGLSSLDNETGGWQNSNLVIIAARPGMGKSAFVVSALRNAAVDFDTPVAIFSLEMSKKEIVQRLMSAEAQVCLSKITHLNLNSLDWSQISHKSSRLIDSNLYIDDTPGISITQLKAKARKLKRQHGIKLLVVDYLQLMSGDGSSKGNREQEIAGISRSLKGLAKELNIPVIALSQLSRAVETRGGDKKPMLSDLRESGSIEQDADMVIFLYRPEYYEFTEDKDGLPTAGIGIAIIAKARQGSLKDVKLRFIGQFTKWTDLNSVDNVRVVDELPEAEPNFEQAPY